MKSIPTRRGGTSKNIASLADLQNEIPCDVIGPYATQSGSTTGAGGQPAKNTETPSAARGSHMTLAATQPLPPPPKPAEAE